ncbi:MAG: hypothetical protein QW160_04500 [Candidatus Bathyarchaeia archaeon]
MTEVPDGATQRQARILELLTFINSMEPQGATITQIQSHMLTVFGLKFKTTSEMVQELTLAGILKADGTARYHLTEKQRQALKQAIRQEAIKDSTVPLVKHIERIQDPKVKAKALRLYQQLLDIVLPADEENRQA